MLVKFGTIIVGARGTVGGATLSANKAGPYAKQWAKGANARTTAQTTRRNYIAQFAQSWAALTGAQRTAWDAYAADPAQELTNSLGEPYYASGFNWFCGMNSNLLQAGDASITNAPVLAVPAAPGVDSMSLFGTASASDSRIEFTDADPNLSMKKAVFMTLFNSQGRLVASKKGPLLTIKQPIIGGAFNGRMVIQSEMEAKFGTVWANQIGYATIFNQNSEGRRSTAVTRNDVLG